MIYSIFCLRDGKTISTIHGDYADDAAAIEQAHCYLRGSDAQIMNVHEGAPFHPFGKMIAQLIPDAPSRPASASATSDNVTNAENTIIQGDCVKGMAQLAGGRMCATVRMERRYCQNGVSAAFCETIESSLSSSAIGC